MKHNHKHTKDCTHNHHNHKHGECNAHHLPKDNKTNGSFNSEASSSNSNESSLNSDSTCCSSEEPERDLSHKHHGHHHHDHHHEHNHDHHDHNHDHHDHCHHHHHKHYEGNNIIIKFWFFILKGLGLVPSGHGDHSHAPGVDHEHSSLETKVWILVVGLIITFFAFFHMFDSIISNGSVLPILSNSYVQFTLGTIMFIIMGIGFIKGSNESLMKKEIAEDTLVAIATTAAFLYSVFAFIYTISTNGELPMFFYEQIEILTLIYLGRFIEEWLINKVTHEMSSLDSLRAKKAILLKGKEEVEVNIHDIKVGDTIVIKTGSVIPVDGKVVFGETSVDESSLTGESLPMNKSIGSSVFGGTVSATGLIHVKVEKLIGDSFISKIIDSVSEAAKTRPASQRIADKIAGVLVPAVLGIAIVTFLITGFVFQFSSLTTPERSGIDNAWLYALYVMITVLVIACPCSFSMTTPMSVLMASKVSKNEGVLFTSKNIFEMIRTIDVICFDKTGTLTEGKFEVISNTIPKSILPMVIGAEKTSTHPLAMSIVEHFGTVKPSKVETKEVFGKGLTTKGDDSINIGSLKFVKEIIKEFKEEKDVLLKRKQGSAFIYVFNKKEVLGYIELKDVIKETTTMALSQIRKLGIDVVMITGDHKDTAINIASQVGIKPENVYSNVSPDDKSQIIKDLQNEGKNVAFVGDGINDSVALTQATIGIAMGEGSDAAIEAADIVLNDNDLTLVAYSMWMSRKTLFNIQRGFGIAIGYNLISVPLAATGILGLTGAGPAIAAASMVFNDSVAMINALTLSNKGKKQFDKKISKK